MDIKNLVTFNLQNIWRNDFKIHERLESTTIICSQVSEPQLSSVIRFWFLQE